MQNTKPNLTFDTNHIDDSVREEWEDRAPSIIQKEFLASKAADSLEEGSHGHVAAVVDNYRAVWVTIFNAHEIDDWLKPDHNTAPNPRLDTGKHVSLIGNLGYEMGSGDRINVITSLPQVWKDYKQIVEHGKKNIRFLAITDCSMESASSETVSGERPNNLYTLSIIPEEDLERYSSGHSSRLCNWEDSESNTSEEEEPNELGVLQLKDENDKVELIEITEIILDIDLRTDETLHMRKDEWARLVNALGNIRKDDE